MTVRVDLTGSGGSGSISFARNGRDLGVMSTTVQGPVQLYVDVLDDCVANVYDGDVSQLVDREDTARERLTRGAWKDGNCEWDTDDEVEKEAAARDCSSATTSAAAASARSQ